MWISQKLLIPVPLPISPQTSAPESPLARNLRLTHQTLKQSWLGQLNLGLWIGSMVSLLHQQHSEGRQSWPCLACLNSAGPKCGTSPLFRLADLDFLCGRRTCRRVSLSSRSTQIRHSSIHSMSPTVNSADRTTMSSDSITTSERMKGK